MSKIKQAFEKKNTFIGFITAGDRGADFTVKAALALEKGGVDILELGVPFSDPIADGIVIQEASLRALKNKTTPQSVLKMVREIRKKSEIPIVLFSYYNPILQGGAKFLKEAKNAGVDALLIVDLPPEEAGDYLRHMKAAKLETVFIATPNTPPTRFQKIVNCSSGFIYYACRTGTTGMKSSLPKDFAQKMKEMKTVTKKPIGVGFGISSQEMAKAVLKKADAFVLGSAFVDAIGKKKSLNQLENLAKKLKP